ncbi:hypothetical protein CT0861_03844 [Colletotrichum tofieldiae]|uniref:Rhodopsin domain-containing protein n=1 Tax=Colletotrichum tofieldiae TaxID=708197 RepID=A0A166R384_9PEZI|nr:hypothetical protein CT0861_03844 [Colletotrichum tofieldiae]
MDALGPPAAAVIATEFTLIGIAATMIGARIYLRLGIQGLPLIASDILICLAWLTAVATASFDIVFHTLGVLRPHITYTLEGFQGTPEQVELVWKIQWAGQFPFFTAFYLCKAALLALYARFFPAFMQTRRKILWGAMAYCGCAYIATVIATFIICTPIEGNWSPDPAVACSPIVFAQVFQIAWALNFTVDIIIFCLPFLVLYRLQLKQNVKISVYCVFLIGAINLAVTLARFLGIQVSQTNFRSFSIIELWSALDLQIGLVIACIPPLRPYLSYEWKIRPFRSPNQAPKGSGNRPELSGFTQQSDHPLSQREQSDSRGSVDIVSNFEGRIVAETHCDVESFATIGHKS